MASIGDKVSSIEFSLEEKERIASALGSRDTAQFRIYRVGIKSINDHRLWRSAQKHFRVLGFRDGATAAREIVARKQFEEIRGAAERKADIPYWPLYRACVHHYVSHELLALNRLLLREEFVTSEGSLTEQIFRLISKCLSVYDASVESASELYELWGFPRSDGVGAILSSVAVDSNAVRRIAEIVARQAQVDLKRDIAEISRRLEALNSQRLLDLENGREEAAKFSELRDRLEEQIRRSQIELSASDAIERRRSPVASASSSSIRRRLDNVGPALDQLTNESNQKLADLGRRIGKLEKRLSELAGSVPDPLTKARGQRQTYGEYFGSVRSAFSKEATIRGYFGIVGQIVSLLRSSRIVVTDLKALVEIPIASIAGSESKTIAASPMWTSIESWRKELDFICSHHAQPRVLVIHDFDVALQETYLIPGLSVFISTAPPHTSNKIVLVPSNEGAAFICPRTLENALCFLQSGEVLSELRDIEGSASDVATAALPDSEAVPLGYLAFSAASAGDFENEVDLLARNVGIDFPAAALRNFVNVFAGLRKVLPEDKSGRIAAAAALLPWIRAERGEAVTQAFAATISRVFGKR